MSNLNHQTITKYEAYEIFMNSCPNERSKPERPNYCLSINRLFHLTFDPQLHYGKFRNLERAHERIRKLQLRKGMPDNYFKTSDWLTEFYTSDMSSTVFIDDGDLSDHDHDDDQVQDDHEDITPSRKKIRTHH